MGGGGGSSSGAISYPPYLTEVHSPLIHDTYNMWKDIRYSYPEHNPVNPASYLMGSTTIGNEHEPIDTLKAYDLLNAFSVLDPDARFKALIDPTSPIGYSIDTARILELRAQSQQLWDELMGDEAVISRDKLVSAHATRTMDIIEATIIPKLELGMRQANMGLSTGFIIGKAIIYDGHNKDIAEFSAKIEQDAQDRKWELYNRYMALEAQLSATIMASVNLGMERLKLYIQQKQTVMASGISLGEALYQHAQKYELLLTDKEIRNTTWGLELANHVGKAIASIAGASTIKEGATINSAASAIGGAASGAVAGAMIGKESGNAGWGAAIGAVVGGVAGYLSAK